MAWRIAESVVRGEIDNRRKGCVTGRIWLVGSKIQFEPEHICAKKELTPLLNCVHY